MNPFSLVLGASIALLATVAGAAGVFAIKRMPAALWPTVIAFGAGMMALSALEMLNEAHAMVGHKAAFLSLLVGMVVLVLLAKSLPHLHWIISRSAMPPARKKATLLAGTITLHNIPEGLAIASAFADSPSLGWLVAISIALQDVPEGMMVSMPAACYGMPEGRSFLWGVWSGVAEFAAAIVGYFCLTALSKATPFALGFSAGAMIYVVLFELLPDVIQSEHPRHGGLAFVAGIAAAYLLSAVIGR